MKSTDYHSLSRKITFQVEVDENGTKAVALVKRSAIQSRPVPTRTVDLTIDHPFLVLIINNRNNEFVPLLTAVVNRPNPGLDRD